ncbi:MAG TPA: (d)CMP kinase, partial [Acidimicrobiales bacterium]|nr:(d)CMP kinase [Acidimicrobiales bacterium]
AKSLQVEVGDRVILEGDDVTDAIRTAEVTAAASIVAGNQRVRTEMVRRQREWAIVRGGGVVEGRDIGSVVFPDARLKLFLSADPNERARRRADETGEEAAVTASRMAERDLRDSTRKPSPLVATADARKLDTTNRTVESLVEEVLSMLEPGLGKTRSLTQASREVRMRTKIEYKPPTKGSLVFFSVCRGIAVGICRLFCRVTVEGRENLPKTGPYVICPVHRSYVDWIVIGCLTPKRIRFMAKDTLWSSRLVGWLLGALGTFPVHRASADRSAFAMCVNVLAEGEPCVMFPEGQRMSGPVVEELFDGAAYVAAKAVVPIVPVGIGGSERVMQKGKKLPRPYKVHLVIGEPIAPPAQGTGGRVPRKAIKLVTEELRTSIQELFDRAQRRVGLI